MHFTKPTTKSYIYDAHLSQSEMLQLLMLMHSIKQRRILNMQQGLQHQNGELLHSIENIATAVACTILMLNMPPAAEIAAMRSAEYNVQKILNNAYNNPYSIINALHVHSDDGAAITVAPVYI